MLRIALLPAQTVSYRRNVMCHYFCNGKIYRTTVKINILWYYFYLWWIMKIENRISGLDKTLLKLEKKGFLMGSFLIRKDRKILYDKTLGNQFIPKDIHINPININYKIGSITKIFTSAIIHKVIEANYIQYNTKLASFFPQIKNSDIITISDMLYHRSGIYNYTDNIPDFMEWAKSFRTKDEMLELICRFEPENLPNEIYQYNNSNYLLLGYILETIYQKPYKYIVKEMVTDVLGLNNTMYAETFSIDNNEIFSYVYNNNVIEKSAAWNLSVVGGAGSLISTTDDMSLFIESLFEGKLLPESIVSKMIESEYDVGIGKGIVKFDIGSNNFYGHQGFIDKYFSVMAYDPIKKISIIYCLNGYNGTYEFPIMQIFKALFGIDLSKKQK
jgi:CubicO group peptidase (beta-lactamase class C family)